MNGRPSPGQEPLTPSASPATPISPAAPLATPLATPLAIGARAARLALAWALLFAASPGVLSRAGSALLALLGVALWAATASRPGRRAFALEALAGGLGSAALCAWSAYVWSGTLAFLVIVPGLYHGLAGVVLRRLAPRASLALAAPAAWIALELARQLAEPPFGFGWLRLGHYLHASPLAGAARVVGTFGVGFAWAAAAGALVELARGLRAARPMNVRAPLVRAVPGALAPAALFALAYAVPAPETVPGPRIMMVQPAFEQARKQQGRRAEELFQESLELTRAGLAQEAAAGRAVDLVAWGETMLPLPLMEEGLEAAHAAGLRSPGWTRDELGPDAIAWSRGVEARWIGERLFGRGGRSGVLPAGTSFLAGAETFVARDGALRRANGVCLWDARGERAGLGGKLHLVPGAEHLVGLERLAWVRDAAFALAGYVPDLVDFERTAVFELVPRAGRALRFGVTVCFDNVFDDPYTAPLRAGPLDFHLVCSNEAWYRTSFEMDQMVAFSRLLALQTGRAFVRATNAGVTIVLGPDGRELARLERDGRDRMVAGTLAVAVPVPSAPDEATPYVRAERVWLVLFGLAPLLVWLAGRRGR